MSKRHRPDTKGATDLENSIFGGALRRSPKARYGLAAPTRSNSKVKRVTYDYDGVLRRDGTLVVGNVLGKAEPRLRVALIDVGSAPKKVSAVLRLREEPFSYPPREDFPNKRSWQMAAAEKMEAASKAHVPFLNTLRAQGIEVKAGVVGPFVLVRGNPRQLAQAISDDEVETATLDEEIE